MSSRTGSLAARVLGLAALLGTAAVLLSQRGASGVVTRLADEVRRLGWAAVPAYASAYLAASLLMLPVSPLTAGAGYLFGWGPGAAIGAVASAAGAVASLEVGRTLGRSFAARLTRALPRFEVISKAVERRGFEVVALLRVTPLVPFPLLNYVLGLTRLEARKFALASLVGMLPGNVFYAYLGSRAGRIAEALDSPRAPGAGGLAAGAAVVGLTALLVGLAGRRLAQAIRQADGEAAGPPPAENGTQGLGS